MLMAVVYGVIAVAMGSSVIWILTGLIALREVAMTVFRSYSLRRHQTFIPANRLGKVKMILQSSVGLAVLAYAYLLNGGVDLRESFVAVPMLAILFVSWFSAAVYVRNWNAARSAHSRSVATIPVDRFEEANRLVIGK
jgi:phosphatidylglycerophosphate synthase